MIRIPVSGRRSFGVKSEVWESFDKQQKKHIYKINQKMKIQYEKMVDPFTEDVVALLMPYIDVLELGNLRNVNSLFEKYVNKRFEMVKEIDIGKFQRKNRIRPTHLLDSEDENDDIIMQMTDRKHNKKVSKKEAFKKFVCTLVAKCPNLTKIYGSSQAIKFLNDETMRQFSAMKKLSKINFANVNFGADVLDQFLLAVGPQLTELSFIDVKALTENGMTRYSYYDRVVGDKKAKGFDSLTNLQVFIAHNFSFVHENYYCTMGSDKLKILRLRSSRVQQKESLRKLELVLEKSPNLELLDVSGARVIDDRLFRAMCGLKKLVVLDVSNLEVISWNPNDENQIAAVRIFQECLVEMTSLKVLNACSMNPLYALSCDLYINIIGENLPNLTEVRGLSAPVLTSTPEFWTRLTAVHLNFHSHNATFAVRDLAAYFRKINFDQNLREFSFECVTLNFSGEYLRPFTAAKSLKKLAIKSQKSSGDESDGFKNYIFSFLGENLENLTINVPGNNGKIRNDDFIILADMSPKLKSLNLHNLCPNSFDSKSTVSEKMTNLRSAYFCFGQHGVTTKMDPQKIVLCVQTCVNLKRLVLCYPLYHQVKLIAGNRCALDFCESVEKEVRF